MKIDSQSPVFAKPVPGAPKQVNAKTGLDERQDKKLKEACKDFEALFMSSLLKAMRKTVQKTNLFGSDSGEETFQEMMDAEVSKSAAKTSSMGIADLMYRQLTDEMARKADPSLLRQAQDAQGGATAGISLLRQAQDAQGMAKDGSGDKQ
jgi:flagellar protein FlgJ